MFRGLRRRLRYLLWRAPFLLGIRLFCRARERVLRLLGRRRRGYQRIDATEPRKRQRLTNYLSHVFPGHTRGEFGQAIDEGRIRVNLKKPTRDTRLRRKDIIELWMEDLEPFRLEPLGAPLEVLHRDEDLAVVRKPAGALSQSIPHRIHEPSVAGSLLAQGLVPPGVGPSLSSGLAHRLDRWTSGLLVVGRTDRALERIQSSFRRRRVRKEYLAVVEGDVRGESGEIDRPITRDYSRVWRFKVAGPNSKRGKRALTRYRVVERLPGATLLAVRILTGRTHQIRVHLSSVGHPVVGDRMYGATRPSGFPPLLLHAARLGLPHPATRRWVRFEAPPDATFEACLRLLRQGAMLQAHASEPALEEAPARVDAPAGEGAPASAEAPSGAVASTREETAALDEASTRTREETAALDEASSATAAPALAEAGDYPSDEDRAGMRASSTSPGSS